MAYTAEKPPLATSTEELRDKIPGWGVDLDPKDRPAVPQERFDPEATGAHWDFPERQPELWPRERSVEHKFLTPVFGTSCPPRGLSGIMRRYAYGYSEGRAAHWLILLAADRVDAGEHHLKSLLTLRPDNPITETGVLSEFSRHGIKSRVGQHRADLSHQPLDPVIVGGPWLAAAAVGGYLTYRVVRSRRNGSGAGFKRRGITRALPAAVVRSPAKTALTGIFARRVSSDGARKTRGRRVGRRGSRRDRLRALFSNERTSGSFLLGSVSPTEVGRYVIGHLPLERLRP